MYRLLPVSAPYLLDPANLQVLETIFECGYHCFGRLRSKMIMYPSLGHTEIARNNG